MEHGRAQRVTKSLTLTLASVDAGILPWAQSFEFLVMVDFAAVRVLIAASGRSRGSVGTLMLFIGLCAALVIPPGVVVCRASGGHSALEPVWSPCCTAADGEGRCAAQIVVPTSAAGQASTGPSQDRCVDTWLGSPVAVYPTPTPAQHWLHMMAALGAVPSVCSHPFYACTALVPTPPLLHAFQLMTTTVLRV